MKVVCENRKARFNYTLHDEYKSGIVLTGCEIKSIRKGDVNITSDTFCIFNNGELFIRNMYIKPYENSGYVKNDEPTRDRKLLLTRHELRKLEQKIKTKGMTIVPVKVIIDDRGLAKVIINLASGKKTYDKSQSIKERDLKRDMERNLK